ncbi:2-oxoglutarate dehydrogenase E1 component [Candidatus Pantoea edessiphila]|uniref:2-oxoglutarate dehydrogenase E1 component n=1 Tax=Candidatus Pantoea edessiphila TaxID=2044610 RepID=A0A2P5SZ35_9GAMM|nr:2-oxoglutarate dehydrogenase E1 component [Candidatus Pantoea edessiphila]MBK4775300.1 2-oxoglutarate dehydrogenase E1 component [Pantoea sp. Edef]PPI87562.1 2-oxoglutarate dehydrogenase E1 component [Candidatus Pantoea edessiphila]
MQNRAVKSWLESSWLAGVNHYYLEKLYEDFLKNPSSIDTEWEIIFQNLVNKDTKSEQFHSNIREYFRCLSYDKDRYNSVITNNSYYKQLKVMQLVNAFRLYSHKYAILDPLGLWKKDLANELNPSFYKLTENDLQESFRVDYAGSSGIIKLSNLIRSLNNTYCGSIGVEYMHVDSIEEKLWIQKSIEYTDYVDLFRAEEKKIFLKNLVAAEGLEKYLGAKFPGAKRFSLEGADVLIPMLHEIIQYSGKRGTQEIVLGMAHRGRLNVLINILGKKPVDLFNEFSGRNQEYLRSGDVKYHMGFSSDIHTEGGLLHLVLAFNPSHLEIISPVIMGSVRARQDRLLTKKDNNKILPITIHGDAALSAQGVVQETLNMSQTRGYEVGGTIRITINNQVGFTTSNPKDSRSTQYCTDIGKMISAPIFHVNADDLEAVLFVSRVATDYRNQFKKDVFIDLVCYRRHGHNESDEPTVTQPLMYQKIKQHPTLRKIYADYLINNKIISASDLNNMMVSYRTELEKGECVVPEICNKGLLCSIWSEYLKINSDDHYQHSVDIKHLQKLALLISYIPTEVKLQERVAKIYNDRKEMAEGKKKFDWGAAENLAYASLIDQGVSIRISGEDSSRGTFFHRHSVVHNQINGSTYIPLNCISSNKGSFEIWDSVLSEEAVLAFEYGYATTEPRVLTIWEAQFGDFANGAQVVIDQFICSGEQKWGRFCGLVMLLPHGYEGQGPEHSSARLERYLQLCAEHNIQVCVPSTPAQMYHMLRRQIIRKIRRPLIVMSPKSLLRHPLVKSTLKEMADGSFQLVIGELFNLNSKNIKRVLMCSGKVYFDLIEQRSKNQQKDIAIVRIEQLYPFPYQELKEMLTLYSHVKDFIWCQEEPLNQGAWCFVNHYFSELLPYNATLRYTSRPPSASPAVGHISTHHKQQQDLINNALN